MTVLVWIAGIGIVCGFGLIVWALLSDPAMTKEEWDRQELKRKELDLMIRSFERQNKGASK